MTVNRIDRDFYINQVHPSPLPTLLCFYRSCMSHTDTAVSIEELSRQFDTVRFCIAQEEDFDFFFDQFHFLGTPIFIFIANGMEQGRLLGSVSTDRLRAFIQNNIDKLVMGANSSMPGKREPWS